MPVLRESKKLVLVTCELKLTTMMEELRDMYLGAWRGVVQKLLLTTNHGWLITCALRCMHGPVRLLCRHTDGENIYECRYK